MKKVLILVALLSLAPLQSLYAYCVYNNLGKTPGERGIAVKDHENGWGYKEIYIGNYACNLTKKRNEFDKSTLQIIWWPSDVICTKEVYNKGGYVVVTSRMADDKKHIQFECNVYRDPN